MKIKGEVKITGFLRVMDLEIGETFTFLDDDVPYFLIDDGDRYVDLRNGEVYSVDDSEEIRPIRRLNVELLIHEEEEV